MTISHAIMKDLTQDLVVETQYLTNWANWTAKTCYFNFSQKCGSSRVSVLLVLVLFCSRSIWVFKFVKTVIPLWNRVEFKSTMSGTGSASYFSTMVHKVIFIVLLFLRDHFYRMYNLLVQSLSNHCLCYIKLLGEVLDRVVVSFHNYHTFDSGTVCLNMWSALGIGHLLLTWKL